MDGHGRHNVMLGRLFYHYRCMVWACHFSNMCLLFLGVKHLPNPHRYVARPEEHPENKKRRALKKQAVFVDGLILVLREREYECLASYYDERMKT